MRGNIEVEGWATLAKALSPPTSLSIEWVAVTSRELMMNAREKDLKTVFKSPEQAFRVGDKFYTYRFGEVGWEEFEVDQNLDGSGKD